MSVINTQHAMLVKVAESLGNMLPEVVFIGGCTTGLFITDDYTREQVRYTDDVDLIVDIGSYAGWIKLAEQLRSRGFRESMDEQVICRMYLGDLQVDFMPTDENVLGFSNRWYQQAMETAQEHALEDHLVIKLVTPEYFVATKLEAYAGRGQGDALTSRDIEDLLNMFDGRPAIVEEIKAAPVALRSFISEALAGLLDDANFEYAVQNASRNNSGREALIFERIEACING